MVETLVTMSLISLAGMVVEKVCYEIGKPTHAQYANLAASSSLGVMALTAALKLIQFIGSM